jgi:putative DNA primase/helicase
MSEWEIPTPGEGSAANSDSGKVHRLAEEQKKRNGEPGEDKIALLFVAEHGSDLRYVARWGQWLKWIGTYWTEDDTLHVFDLVRKTCRDALGLKLDAKTVAGAERLARCDRRVAATVDQWDADIWLLNTPGGSVDLRTGLMREHRREDYCTKMAAVAPGGACDLWLSFLDRITNRDDDLIAFLQRMLGYALTGSTSAHALFFGYGTGANGKSVAVNTASGILGDYAGAAPMETFTASHTDRHPTELAGLRGKRLVTASETEEGRRWAESKIKTLTGGDKVSARFMRQDFFEFLPQFKLFIVGNHKPGLRGVDEAMRRRMSPSHPKSATRS